MSAHRFRAWVERLGEGTVALSPEESHHVARVLRMREGDAIELFDGRGSAAAGRIEAVDRRRVSVRVLEPLADVVESPRPVHLYQAAARPERIDVAVREATELGAASISIWLAGEPAPKAARVERWRRIALEAAKQSGRRLLPPIELLAELPAVGDDELGLLCDERAKRPLAAVECPAPTALRVAVGPAAGLSDDDRAAALDRGWQPVGLGPRRLRTETAGVVALALALHRWGDLGAV